MAYHFLHLRFGRAAVACHGLLHLQGGVFGDGQVLRDQRRHAGAARLAEQQGGLGIDVDEDDFDHGHVWGVAAADFAYAVIQELEPRGQAALGRVCALDDVLMSKNLSKHLVIILTMRQTSALVINLGKSQCS